MQINISADGRMWRYRLRTIFLGPFVVGMAIVGLFALVPQMREIYLGLIEHRDHVRGLAGLGLVVLLCALLDCWQTMLATAAIDRNYPDHGNVDYDQRLLFQRDVLSWLTGVMPLVGLALGLGSLYFDLRETEVVLRAIPADQREYIDLTGDRAFAAAGGAMIAALVVLIAGGFARRRLHARAKLRGVTRYAIVAAGGIVTLLALLRPLVAPDRVVSEAQAMGPLAMTAVVLIALVCVLMFFSLLSQLLRVPVTGMVIVWLLWSSAEQIYATLVVPREKPVPRENHASSESGKTQLAGMFDRWWQAREAADFKEYGNNGQPYPIFVVAAQGGGIYATSTAAAFLTSMHEVCPGFTQHVFAISAVSGGAVGSSLFSAAFANKRRLRTDSGCRALVDNGEANRPRDLLNRRLSRLARESVLKDHLSPALAMIWPDVLRKLGVNAKRSFDRSSVIERSFACALTPQPRGACAKVEGPKAQRLWMPYSGHWVPERAGPALVLNSTWVETGYRVAFAPFPLHAISDGTLFSFFKDESNKGDFELHGAPVRDRYRDRTLVEAAFVSARFPGIAPAWRQTKPRGRNFVDGGYVDNSGATTALDIYRALDEFVKNKGLSEKVSLHLILLTDADTRPDLTQVPEGTVYNDTVAPIMALLKVREQLATRAVTEAVSRVEPGATDDGLAGRNGASKVLVVNLRQNNFQLALGWKISKFTDDLVRLMLGRAEFCGGVGAPTNETLEALRVRNDNSCVKRRLQQLLSPREANRAP